MRHQDKTAALLVILLLAGCEFIPGTAAYREARARDAVTQALIDPSSAQFRNVDDRDGAVCGEVNGKNRMGAYVGFVRFYVDTASWRAVLDPQFDPESLYSARRLCSSLTSYDAASCARQAEEEAKQALQAAFDRFWLDHCVGRGRPGSRPPFDPTGGAEAVDNLSETLDDSNMQDSNVLADSEAGLAPTDAPLFDADENPVDAIDNGQGSAAVPHPEGIDQNWLDRAAGRGAEDANQAKASR
jgi:hypothetical protein